MSSLQARDAPNATLRVAELIRRSQAGDPQAFGELWKLHEPRVAAFCAGFVRGCARDPATDGDDLSTETFIRALHKLPLFDLRRTHSADGFGAWLIELARNTCLNHIEKHRTRARLAAVVVDDACAPGTSTLSVVTAAERRALLREAAESINRLAPGLRSAFRLHLEERSNSEVGKALGISSVAAGKRVQRARLALRPILDAWSVDEQLSVERSLSDIVSDYRVVDVTLANGAVHQIVVRTEGTPPTPAHVHPRTAASRTWRECLSFGESCFHSGLWDAAAEAFAAVIAIQPGCAEAALHLGDIRTRQERTVEARRIYEAALAHTQDPFLCGVFAGERDLAMGRAESAVHEYRAALRLRPNATNVHWRLHRALGLLSRYGDQLDNLRDLRRADPRDVDAFVNAYTPCARLARFDLASPLMKRAVALDPNYPPAIKHLYQARVNLGVHDDDTQSLAERLVRLAPQLASSWNELSSAYLEAGRAADALAIMSRFVEQHPNNAEAWAALSWRQMQAGLAERALASGRRAYELQSGSWYNAWTLLAMAIGGMADAEIDRLSAEIHDRFRGDAFMAECLSKHACSRRREVDAIRYAEEACSLAPEAGPAWLRLAETYHHFGRWSKAWETLRNVIERPYMRTAQNVVLAAACLLELKDEKAEALLGESVALARTPAACLYVGQTFARYGRRVVAARLLRRCIRLAPPPARVGRAAQALLNRR